MSPESPRSRFLRFKQSNSSGPDWGTNPHHLDAELLTSTLRRLNPLFHPERGLYPATVHGWENLPDPGSLLIANHSGGTVIPDVWGLGAAWYRHHGLDRPVHALAHEMVFSLDRTARFFARRGVLRATRSMARTVLTEHKRDLLVLPGGDLDTWRPFRERWTVDFHGRRGYARIALQTGAPVVPIAHAGAHHTLIVLDDGRRIAELLRFPELFRAHIFPVHLSLPYGLGIGPLPHLPPPTPLRYRIGRAVHPEALAAGVDPTQEQIDALDVQVRAELQHQLDVLREESDAMLDRVDAAVQKVRGAVVHLRDRDLEPRELARFARDLVGRRRRILGVAAK